MSQGAAPSAATRWVILTGASRGLGLALAQQLLAEQAGEFAAPATRLLTLSRQPSPDLDQHTVRPPHQLTQWAVDLTQPDALEAAARRVSAWLGTQAPHPTELTQLTEFTGQTEPTEHSGRPAQLVLINNAARLAPAVPLADCPPDDLAQTLTLGLHAPMRLTGAVLAAVRAWTAQGWAGDVRVLNISSGLGRRAMAAQSPYCAVKAGLDHFSRCIALEQHNLPNPARIVSLAPGVIDTGMQTELRSSDPAAFPDRERFVQLKAQAQLDTPLGCAQKILRFVASPRFGDSVIADLRDETNAA